jgi:hypothetical protein
MKKRALRPDIVRLVPDLGTNGLGVLQEAFTDIRVDPYCEGRNRYRAVSRFDCSQCLTHGRLVLLPRAPLIDADGSLCEYPDLSRRVAESEALLSLVQAWLLSVPARLSTLTIQQIRAIAPAAPTADTKRRHGSDWMGITMIARKDSTGVVGGATRVWNQNEELLFDQVLSPGELVSFDDRVTLHEESMADGEVRDVLVFSTPDHEGRLKSVAPGAKKHAEIRLAR